jgi:uncharacterized membrane protein
MSSEVKGLARLEMFSDGVFAIAITLLVLDLKVPPLTFNTSPSALWHSLAHLWPYYFAFAFSFGNILVMWINHSLVFKFIDKDSKRLLYANGFLLLTITFFPYPTAILAEYIGTGNMQPAIVFYCASCLLRNIGWNIFIYTLQKPVLLLKPETNNKVLKKIRNSTRTGFFIYSIITITAWWLPVTALVLNVLTWLLWISVSLLEQES